MKESERPHRSRPYVSLLFFLRRRHAKLVICVYSVLRRCFEMCYRHLVKTETDRGRFILAEDSGKELQAWLSMVIREAQDMSRGAVMSRNV